MKTEYLLAISIMALFVSASFFAMAQMETASVNRLRASLEDASIEAESARLTMLLAESFGEGEKYCAALNQRISSQLSKNFAILSQIETTEREVFLADIVQLKKRYFLSNAQLYYYLKQSKDVCSPKDTLLLYFYIDETPCPDCHVQGKILDSLRMKCQNLKVFAFPVDIDLETTNFFKSLFGISEAPAVVLNDSTVLSGLYSEAQILQYFECQPAG